MFVKRITEAALPLVLALALTTHLIGCGGSKSRRSPVTPQFERPAETIEESTEWERNVKYRSLLEQGNYQELENMARSRMEKDSKDADARFFIAQSLIARNRIDEAFEHFEKASELSPQNRSYSRIFAQHLDKTAEKAVQRDQVDQAIELWKRCLELKYRPRQTERNLAEAYRRHGEKLADGGAQHEAESAFREAIGILPDNPVPKLNLAEMLIDSDRLFEAQMELKELVKLHPTYVEGIIAYVKLLRRQGDVRGAMEQLQKALRVDPDNSAAITLKSELDRETPIMQADIADDPPSIDIPDQSLIRNLSLLEASDDFSGQASLLERYRADNPAANWAKLRLALVYERMDKVDEGLKVINEYLDEFPDDIRAKFLKARFMQLSGNFSGALVVLKALESEDNANLQVFDEIGQVYAKLGQFEEAESYWNKVLDADPEYSSVLFNFGQLAMERRNFQQAREYFERAINKEPFNLKFRFAAGLNLKQAGFHDEATALWESSRSFLNPSDPYGARILRALGEAAPQAGTTVQTSLPSEIPLESSSILIQEPPAKPLLPSQIIVQPDDPVTESLYNSALEAARAGMFQEAVAGFRAVLQRSPSHFNAEMNLGNVYKAQSDIARAAAHYLSALRIDSVNIHALRALAGAYNELGLHPYAAGIVDRVKKSSPNELEGFPKYSSAAPKSNPRAYEPIIKAFCEIGRTDEAMAIIKTGLSEHPDLLQLLMLQGEVHQTSGDYAQAEIAFKKALEMDKNNPEPYIRLGDLYAARNQPTHALTNYQNALKANFIDPDSMFGIVDRFRAMDRNVDAEQLLNRIKGMNLSQSQLVQLQARLRNE